MLKNTFLDRLKSIHFKQEIPIIYMCHSLYIHMKNCNSNYSNSMYLNQNGKLLDLLKVERKIKKIHSMKCNDKFKIMKLIFYKDGEFTEYFINFEDYNDSLFRLHSERNIGDFERFLENYYLKENDIKNALYFNIKDSINKISLMKEHIMSVTYEYRYIRGSKGEKELVPIETLIPNKLRISMIINLLDKYCKELRYYSGLKYYLNYRIKKKRTKYEKILVYIFKERKHSYFNLLTDDLKREICLYL